MRFIERVPNWIRWVLTPPVAIGTGFLAASLVGLITAGARSASGDAIAYAGALVSGFVFAFVAVYAAHELAPEHKRIVSIAISIFILGDLTIVHVIYHTDMLTLPDAEESGIGIILDLLRVDDYRHLKSGGIVRVAGAFIGCALVAWTRFRTAHD